MDSRFHDTDLQSIRDEWKDQIFALGGLELSRLPLKGQSTPTVIRQMIREEIAAWRKRVRATPQGGLALNIEPEIDFCTF